MKGGWGVLEIAILIQEYYDEKTCKFNKVIPKTIKFEHSLLSISKWESKWERPFLSKKDGIKTYAEMLDYFKCMTVTPNVDDIYYSLLTPKQVTEIKQYINAKMTATWFSEEKSKPDGETKTSELLYYYMLSYQIPFECEKWHLNRLLTLIRICDRKANGPKKMSKSEIIARNNALNDQRRKQLNSKG